MNKKIIILAYVVTALGTQVYADTTSSRRIDPHPAQRKTADSQMQGSNADIAVTRKIRDRLTDMDNLSTRAQNVTIVTTGNNVTLKGEVDKQEEIQAIMKVTQETAQGKTISNQLRVHN